MPNDYTVTDRNRSRATRAANVLDHYKGVELGEGGPADVGDETLVDLMTDLMHFCAQTSVANFDVALRMARANFEVEQEGGEEPDDEAPA